jgi:hypothetical protein
MLNMTAIADALKLYYLEGLRYQMNDKSSAFLAQLERDTENVEGSKIVMALRYGVVGGIGNRTDDGTLPTPNSRKTKKAEWETKNWFSRFQLTDKTIKASRSNVGSFARMLETEISDCETDAKRDLSRQSLGDETGIVATITSVNGAVATCDNALGVQYLAEGMLVDVWDTSGGVYLNQGVEVTAVDRIAKTVTLSALGAGANGDLIYVAGNKGMELSGLKAVFENASLYGIDRNANKWLNGTKINVAGEIAEMIIQQGIDDAEIEAGGQIGFGIGSYGVRRSIVNLLQANKQTVNTMELKGGFTAVSYNGVPIVADKFIAPGELYFLDLNDWKLYHMGDFDWLDKDGAMLHRVTDKPAWEATMVRYCDIGCQKPKAQVKLYGITERSI